jgi:hypothetical protein
VTGTLLLFIWLCAAAAALYWAAQRFGVRRDHSAIFAGSVGVAFLLGWLLHAGGTATQTATAAAPAAPHATVSPAIFRDALSGLQVPDRAGAGKELRGSVVVENRSPLAWPVKGDTPVLLGFHILDASGKAVGEGRAELHSDVAPGERRRVSFVVTAPSAPGSYTLAVDLLCETVSWFEAFGNRPARQALTVS